MLVRGATCYHVGLEESIELNVLAVLVSVLFQRDKQYMRYALVNRTTFQQRAKNNHYQILLSLQCCRAVLDCFFLFSLSLLAAN